MRETITFVTCATATQARQIATVLVKERLAACGNIIPGLTSIYVWKGRLEKSSECLLLLKSRADLSKRLTQRVRELHSYEVPEVVTIPIASGNPDYLRWVRESTR